ncbi:post-segregation antitoxin CcdA [Candidatus Scalindua japonica]|uniref:Post-segregation antitoxin CcdA n=1 Tax=Candidatus Scalindua japonica TaxID=1284222 RepID=A0A286U2M9_9BACT|nr:hypothetical protein [Candidatus Scalindua japonica]GAX62377.1 post-segregation antitoxin CcdA [Candidatus Scalindua japonica]
MSKKEDIIVMRIGKEHKAFLQKKAKEMGVSLSKLIEESLHDTFKSDKEQILDFINKRKEERPTYWKTLDESPIARGFENYIVSLFTEFVNPISRNPWSQPVVLLGWIKQLLEVTIKYFDSIPEENKKMAADYIIMAGKTLIDGFTYVESEDKETQEHIIDMKKELAEKASYHFTALAFEKESYNTIKRELEKVREKLVKELKEK